MTAPAVKLYPGAASAVRTGGTPVIAVYGGVLSAYIVNPVSAADQGTASSEYLFVDATGPAALAETATTVALVPGQEYVVPAGQTTPVYVNSVHGGHRFSVVVIQPPTPFPPTPFPPTPMPPTAPTSLAKVIPSYLYQEYSDDDDLQAFVASFNALAQSYVDTLNAINLPIYTSPIISGALLDWVASGMYGLARPALASGESANVGPLNTYAPNTIALNKYKLGGPVNVFSTSDDAFKRIITWHFFKGDGKVFNTRWLKRRVLRFLLGANGKNIDASDTSKISVTFGTNQEVTITLTSGVRTVTGGAIPNTFVPNSRAPNQLLTTFRTIDPLPNSALFAEAVAAGVLELPFQYSFVVVT